MDKVWLIYREDHDLMEVCKSYESAIEYLKDGVLAKVQFDIKPTEYGNEIHVHMGFCRLQIKSTHMFTIIPCVPR